MAKLKHPTAAFVNIGGKIIPVGKDGTVDVPDEHAEHLVKSHGFELAEAPKKPEGKKGD